MPQGKASKLLTDHLITGKPFKSEPEPESTNMGLAHIDFFSDFSSKGVGLKKES